MKFGVTTKRVAGSASSQGRRPVGAVRSTTPRLAWKQRQGGPASRVIGKTSGTGR